MIEFICTYSFRIQVIEAQELNSSGTRNKSNTIIFKQGSDTTRKEQVRFVFATSNSFTKSKGYWSTCADVSTAVHL